MPTFVNNQRITNLQDYILSGQPYSNGNGINGYNATDDIPVSGGNVYIDNNDVYHTNADLQSILGNLDVINDIVSYHEKMIVPKYQIKRDYYKGRHRTIMDKQPTALGKPDNRLTINLPKKLVDTFNGFFIGDPIQVKYVSGKDGQQSNSDDDINAEINDWCNVNNVTDIFSEYSRTADIYGRAYLRAFLNNDQKIGVTALSPRDTIVVYDNTSLNDPIFAINYSMSGADIDGWIITPRTDYHFQTSHGVGSNGGIKIVNATDEVDKNGNNLISPANQHPSFPCLPVFELPENVERVGIFDNVLSLIDSVDEIQSSKGNDIGAISNGILVVTGVQLSEEQIQNVATTHVLNLYQDQTDLSGTSQTPKAEYVTPDINDEMQEHMLDRNIDQVYQNAQVVNMNDSKFGASASSISGIALKQRYQDMMGKAETKSNKMDTALRSLFQLLFSNWSENADVKNLEFTHKQSIPHNLLEEAQTAVQLDGQVTPETKMKSLSLVKDPSAEVAAMKAQGDSNGQSVQNVVNNAIKNSGKSNDTGGDNDDNNFTSQK